ncbi:unnamed protein product [Caenorhabditis nigoni]
MVTEPSQDFNITNVGYYKRDNEMNVTVDALPRCVNSNYNRLLELQGPGNYIKENHMNLESPEVQDNGNIENFFESLLNYISIKGFGEEKPRFVTYKQVLADVASKPSKYAIRIVCHMDIIFISYKKWEENPEMGEIEQKKKTTQYTIGANFAHYWTKETEDGEIPEDYATSSCKAVMKCDVKIGGIKELVVYSAQIDALEKDSGKHVQIRTIGNNNVWRRTVCTYHWKMFFGNDTTMILGVRAEPDELSDCALRSIEVVKLEEVFKKMKQGRNDKKAYRGVSNKLPFPKSAVDNGKERVRQFLSKVKDVCNESDGCFLAKEENKVWSFEKVDEEHDEVREFANLVKSKMAVWKVNFPNESSN